ncbi:MAG TPA: hypothetical protein VN775_03705, partial [Opitutaceae bacterium]|nr:hypothetical protein [Opitutaceae bacterium]
RGHGRQSIHPRPTIPRFSDTGLSLLSRPFFLQYFSFFAYLCNSDRTPHVFLLVMMSVRAGLAGQDYCRSHWMPIFPMTAGGGCMGESRMFKVGNELTDLPRHMWYYDTINVAVKCGFAISGK